MPEIELKLALPPKDLSKAHRILATGRGRHRAAQRKLTSTYYDTQGLDLRRRDLTLRVRREGRSFVQTVKAENLTGQDLTRRGEWEDKIDDERPDLSAPKSGRRLPSVVKPDQLRQIFSTVVQRSELTVRVTSGAEIDIAVDRGEIRANGGTEPISELELELRNGDPVALFDAALKILDHVPARLETRSKSARGYLMVEGDADPPVRRLPKIELDPKTSGDEALQLIGRHCMASLAANLPAALADCPEGVHQMRVAARRLRSILSVMKKMLPHDRYRWANDELRWLSDAAGPARNWDVIAERLVKQLSPSPIDLSALADRVERERRAAYKHMKAALQSPRFTRAVIGLARFFEAREWRNHPASEHAMRLDAPVEEIAPDLLDRALHQVRKRGRCLRQAGVEQRHRLRIALKKLRYSIDFLCSLYDEDKVGRYLRRLKRLQDEFGDGNDVRVAQRRLTTLGHQPQESDRAAGFVLGWHSERIAEKERALLRRFRRFKRLDPFW